MLRVSVLLLAICFAFVLTACGQISSTASPLAAPASTIGQRVPTEGGAYTDITADELHTMLGHKDFTFVNVHIPYAGDIAQTDVSIPYNEIANQLAKLPADKNAKIVLYCRSDRMSVEAAQVLVKLGYTNVYQLTGGMVAWEKAGYPLVTTAQ